MKEDIIPKARGKAQSILRAAEAYKAEREKTAEGDADRFLAVLTEYQKAMDLMGSGNCGKIVLIPGDE